MANSQAKSDLGNTLSYYITHPGEFIHFLYRKTVSQWCNPDFQGTWVTRHSSFIFKVSYGTKYIMSMKQLFY